MKALARVVLMTTAAMVGCRNVGAGDRGNTRAPATKPDAGASQSALPSQEQATKQAMTPERLRAFAVETHIALTKIVDSGYKKLGRKPKPSGSCSDGQPALPLVKTADAMPEFEKRLEGRALQCYLATYFRCRVDGWLAHAVNRSDQGPPNVPFLEAKVTIVKQTPTLVVADIVEGEPTVVLPNGHIDREEVTDFNFASKARYTLKKDAAGTWRIADRVPNNGPMACEQY